MQLKVNDKKIMNPPEKVLKMYQAVIGFLHDNQDMTTLKVSDITARAGIGKGTAYEYFSSKEELISCAMMWGIAAKIRELSDSVSRKESFRDKCFCIFDWLEKYEEYAQVMFRILKGSFGRTYCAQKEQIERDFVKPMQSYVFGNMEEMLETGYREGVLTIEDKEKRMLAFFGGLLQYAFFVIRPKEAPALSMEQSQMKEFIYGNMIKTLN